MKYQVTINQVWSESVVVTAGSKAEAKKAKKDNYSLEVEQQPTK